MSARAARAVWVTSRHPRNGDFGVYPGESEALDDGLVRLWFYVSTWNSRMMFIAKGCELERA